MFLILERIQVVQDGEDEIICCEIPSSLCSLTKRHEHVRPSGFNSTSARGRSCISKGEPSSVKRSKTEAMASRSASRTLRMSLSNSFNTQCDKKMDGVRRNFNMCIGDKRSSAPTCCRSWKLMYPLSSLSTSFAMASSLSALILYPKYLHIRWLSCTLHGAECFSLGS